MFSSFAWDPEAGMREGKHVILDMAFSGRRSGAKRSDEAQRGTTVIVVEMSTLRSANNNVKCYTARSTSY